MKIIKSLRNTGIYSATFTMLFASVQAPVMAAMVSTPELSMQADLQLQRADVREFIARDDVRAAMLDYGVNAADIDTRINNLTSAELLQIQNQLAELPAGSGALGVVLGVILIFVLLDVLGATDIFPNI